MTTLRQAKRNPVTVLLAGGLDPSGRAGLIADIEAVLAAGARPMAVVTALTVQNTTSGYDYFPVDADIVARQLSALVKADPVDVIKIGMVGSFSLAEVLGGFVRENGLRLIYDPVLKASSGLSLADEETIAAVKSILIPVSYLITPNADEAAVLSGVPVKSEADVLNAARNLASLGAEQVLITGGHLPAKGKNCVDYLYNGKGVKEFREPRIQGSSARGTGCVTAATIAAQLAAGNGLDKAITLAKKAAIKRIMDEPG